MRIHIVWSNPDGDRILDRLSRTLAEQTGWSLSTRPEPGMDLNYSMIYIDFVQRFSDWRKTPWAAYFSHYEPSSEYRKYWWNTADALVRYKTITALQYAADLHGAITQVTPPIDKQFEIRQMPKNKKKLVGVSGFIDRLSGRKGERMLSFIASDLADEADFVASGEGWPLRTINHGFDGLCNFYNSLDLYVCASSIEGIPMPPLEALRCGIPVIIPRGVGILDDLPSIPGITRWQPGEGQQASLEQAIAKALLAPPVDREALAKTTEKYTDEAWGSSHVQGFEKLASQPTTVNLPGHTVETRGARGVYYVAYGDPARKCAEGAITSFKQFMPNIPVALVGEKPIGNEDTFIQNPDLDIGGRLAKVRIDELAPAFWSYICYLDADTEIIAASTFLWEIIEDGWDMVICKNPDRFHIASQMHRSDNVDECKYTFDMLGTDQLIQLNGGVFAYQRNARTRAFFHCWVDEWKRYGKRDQGALLRALNQYPLKLYVLGNEWNTITRYDAKESAAWLLHYPMLARRWRGVIDHPLSSPEAWAAVDKFKETP